jgi:hypothetical protein
MPRRRTLAVLVLAALTTLSPTLAQSHPRKAERAAPSLHLLDLLLDRLARIQEKLLGAPASPPPVPGVDHTDSGSGIDPDGAT